MSYFKKIIIVLFTLINCNIVYSFTNEKINFGSFYLNKFEVTIQEFKEYADKNKIITEAEKTGGGYEWGAGWEKRSNWNYLNPYGKKPESELEPAVHISRYEAENYCKFQGGRLPTFDEWKLAAYTQQFKSDLYKLGKTYKYPSGDLAVNMNSQGILNYDRHVAVTILPEGINGLVAMGGNVWEWIDDQEGESSLTAGASWWYGAAKTRKEGAQFKPSNFYAIYVGFRCAFENK